jgi:hypothetical protein
MPVHFDTATATLRFSAENCTPNASNVIGGRIFGFLSGAKPNYQQRQRQAEANGTEDYQSECRR